MNLHILVFPNGRVSPWKVEVFTSRDKMVKRKIDIKRTHNVAYMFPPVEIGRSVEGIIRISQLVDNIHCRGPVAVLEEMENGDD